MMSYEELDLAALVPSGLPYETIYTFLHGECWSFAYVAAQMIDAPPISLCEDQAIGIHMALDLGNGRFFDAAGIVTADMLIERYDVERPRWAAIPARSLRYGDNRRDARAEARFWLSQMDLDGMGLPVRHHHSLRAIAA